MSTINKILDILDESGIELVSYGLAPNPFGFCYELPEHETQEQFSSLGLYAAELEGLLKQLNTNQENELKKLTL